MDLLGLLANSAALFIGNVRVGLGIGTQNRSAEKAIADAVFNALNEKKRNIELYELKKLIESKGYMIENISLICKGIKTIGLKERIKEDLGDVKMGISEVDSEYSEVLALVLLVKKVIKPENIKKEIESSTSYI